ncbi:MAG: RHS repeat-associated core domain-containing protein, partial [Chloroflexi bacterium]|nr:RHS repeat-associated core domain-containing protein [Chloroflexota bacterium]
DNGRVQQIDHSGPTAVTTTYHNDNMGLSQVLMSDDGTTQTTNLFGLDLIRIDDGTETRIMLADGLGSARVEMVNGMETTTTYEPYGKVLTQAGTSGTVYGYTGEQEDAATGLLYLRARYYNPYLYQFQSRDPFPGTIIAPASQHGYAYGLNNPVMNVDPSGLCVENGDEYCWSLAEQAVRDNLGTLTELGALTTIELEQKLYGPPSQPLPPSIPALGLPFNPVPQHGQDLSCSLDFPTSQTDYLISISWFGSQKYPKDCAGLLQEILSLRNELVRRYAELRENKLNLPQSGPMSIEGHQDQFEGKQSRLRKLLDTYRTNGCGGSTRDAQSWATVPVPSPAPKANNSPITDSPIPAVGIPISPETIDTVGDVTFWGTVTVVGGYVLYNSKGCLLGPVFCILDLITPVP